MCDMFGNHRHVVRILFDSRGWRWDLAAGRLPSEMRSQPPQKEVHTRNTTINISKGILVKLCCSAEEMRLRTEQRPPVLTYAEPQCTMIRIWQPQHN